MEIINQWKETTKSLFNSKEAQDRLAFAQIVKALMEMADDFLKKKELLEPAEIEGLLKTKSELESILNDYKIYELNN